MIHLGLDLLVSRMAIGFSNVPGPKKPFVVGGARSSMLGFEKCSWNKTVQKVVIRKQRNLRCEAEISSKKDQRMVSGNHAVSDEYGQ